MYYDSQIIYSSTDNSKNFQLDGNTYYRTAGGKPKLVTSGGKRTSLTEQEFQKAQREYNFIFDKTVNL